MIMVYRQPQTSDRYHTTWPVPKLNSYILQSSCRGGMQRVIRYSNLTLHTQRTYRRAINTLLYKYISVGYQQILSTLSVQPCMHPHTTLIPLSVQLVATYTSTCIAQSETRYLWLKSVVSIPTAAKLNLARSHNKKMPRNAVQYGRILIPCMENNKNITIPRIIG